MKSELDTIRPENGFAVFPSEVVVGRAGRKNSLTVLADGSVYINSDPGPTYDALAEAVLQVSPGVTISRSLQTQSPPTETTELGDATSETD